MKRKIFVTALLAAVLLLCIGCIFASAASGSCGDNLKWTVSGSTLTISGTGEMTSHPWTDYNSSIKKIVVEEGVTTIMEYAFSNCHFTEIELPDSLVSIGEDAFWNCTTFTTIEIPKKVDVIVAYTFRSCYDLANVTFHSPDITIEDNAFTTCDLTIIRGYKYSGAERFAKKKGYTFEAIGEVELKTLAEGALNANITWKLDTHGLLKVEGSGAMPDYVYDDRQNWWHDYADCITRVKMSDGITSVGGYAFNACESLEEVDFSENITKIGSNAFYGCNILTTIGLPVATTEIGRYAFARCNKLESVTVSYKTIMFGTGAFQSVKSTFVMKGYNNSIAQMYAEDEEIAFEVIGEAIDEVAIEGRVKDGISWSVSSTGVLTLTGSGKILSMGAYDQPWADCTNDTKYLKKIVIGDGITWLDAYVFKCPENCEIVIPYGVLFIENNLANVPKSAIIKGYSNSVAEDAAIANSLTFVSLGETPDVVVESGDLGSLKWSISALGELVISGEGSMPTYYNEPWEFYYTAIKNIVVEKGITYISKEAFVGCTDAKSITISHSVMDFHSGALNGLEGITVYGYTDSETEAFAQKKGFTFVSLGEMPREVIASGSCGDSLVWEYDNHKILTITGDGYMSADAVPWASYSSKIKNVVMEGEIASIMANAFKGTLIESIEIPESVVFIDYAAFEECNKLTYAILPFGVRVIGARAFYGCDRLDSVGIPYSTIMIGGEAFDSCPLLTIYGYEEHVSQRVAQIAGTGFESLGEIGAEFGLYDYLSEDCQWRLNNYGELVISGTGDMPDFNIDAYYCPWYSGYGANVTSIVIEDGITSVGDYAFLGCETAENLEIGSDVKSVGEYAFFGIGIKELLLPNNVKSIGIGAFAACEKLKSVWLPSNVTSIEPYTFSQCTSLMHIEIPKTVTKIGEYAFDNTSLQYVYYKGTKSSWTAKVSGKGNIPEGAIFIYSSTGLPKESMVKVSSASKTSKGAKVKLTVELKGGEKIYIVGYDADNAQTALMSVSESDTYTLTGDIKKVKVLLWEDENSLNPLAEVYTKSFE